MKRELLRIGEIIDAAEQAQSLVAGVKDRFPEIP